MDAGTDYPHVPVLLQEVLDAFQPVQLHTYLDCTLGAGGHAVSLLQAHPEMRRLCGIDVDPAAHAVAARRIVAVEHAETGSPGAAFHPLRGNYSQLRELLAGVEVEGVQGVLMDLGISSMQVDTAERGFSLLQDGPIDMRMNPDATTSAQDILNTWSEAALGRIFRDYGEEKLWKLVAARIVGARADGPITSTLQLTSIVGDTQLWARKGGKRRRKGPAPDRIHPATRVFQALRIAVNDELGQLEIALPDAIEALAPGGRLAVISFHSLEDRIVKRAFLKAAGRDQDSVSSGVPAHIALLQPPPEAQVALVTRKPLIASEDEVAENPRSRSAKLRVVQKL